MSFFTPMPTDDLLGSYVENHLGNINEMSDDEVLELLADCDAFVYAIGADERWLPDAPAYRSFYQANIIPTQRIARLFAQAGVKKFVLYGSYFAEFAELMSDSGHKDMGYPGTSCIC